MQRAAAGLARRCAAMLLAGPGQASTAPGCCCWSAPATTAATRCTPAPRWPGAARQVAGAAAGPDRAHAGRSGRPAARPAGGSSTSSPERGRTWWWTGSSASAARGGLRGPPPPALADGTASDGAPAAGGRGGRAQRGRRRHRARAAAPAVRADVTVTFGASSRRCVVGPAAALAGQVELVDIGLRPACAAPGAAACPTRPTIAGWWPRPGRRRRQVHAAAWSGWRPARRPTPARRCSSVRRRAGRAGRHGALRRYGAARRGPAAPRR